MRTDSKVELYVAEYRVTTISGTGFTMWRVPRSSYDEVRSIGGGCSSIPRNERGGVLDGKEWTCVVLWHSQNLRLKNN